MRDNKWILLVTIFAFIITLFFSSVSQLLLKNINIFVGVLIILLFIFLGIIFDIIGVAVQSSSEEPFHAMASKKIKGAHTAKRMIKNSAKVSSFCNDVIGDICNIITGSSTIVVSSAIAYKYSFDYSFTLLIFTSIVASLTIGGKALGKAIAVNNSEKILHTVSKIIK